MMEDNNDEMILNGYDYDKINHCTQKYVIKQRPFLFIGQVTSEYFLITCERRQKIHLN